MGEIILFFNYSITSNQFSKILFQWLIFDDAVLMMRLAETLSKPMKRKHKTGVALRLSKQIVKLGLTTPSRISAAFNGKV